MSALADQPIEATTSVELRVEREIYRGEPRRKNVCPTCRKPKAIGPARCDACIGLHFIEGALIDPVTPYIDDVACQLFVATYADGAPHQYIGDAFGITRSRVQQIEKAACRHLIARCKLADITVEDLVQVLGRADPQEHTYTAITEPRRTYGKQGERIEPADLDEPSPFVRALLDALDEAIVVGDLVGRALEHAERER